MDNKTYSEVFDSLELRMELFKEMLSILESSGKCRGNYHLLALYLFGDSFSDEVTYDKENE